MSATTGVDEAQRRRYQKRPRMLRSVVYFIQEGTDGPIKVGWSTLPPEKRVATMQVGNPRELRLVGFMYGTKDDEMQVHRALAEYRIRGEWFLPSPGLLAFAARQDRLRELDDLNAAGVGSRPCEVLAFPRREAS